MADLPSKTFERIGTAAVWQTDRFAMRISDIIAVVRHEIVENRIDLYVRGLKEPLQCRFPTPAMRDETFKKLTEAIHIYG